MACLDTSALLDLLDRGGRGRRDRARELLRRLQAAGETFATTRFTIAELWVGIERAREPAREQARVESVLDDLQLLEFDEVGARIFGKIPAFLQKRGISAGDMDVLIASVSLAHGHSLVTRDMKHFSRIPGLAIEGY